MNNLAVFTIKAEIVFGSPRRECRGFGICKVVETSPNRKYHGCTSGVPAQISVLSSNGISVFMKQECIPSEIMGEHFGGEYFIVEHPYYFTPEMSNKLGGQNVQLVIPTGVYFFTRTNKGVNLYLSLLSSSVVHTKPALHPRPQPKNVSAS